MQVSDYEVEERKRNVAVVSVIRRLTKEQRVSFVESLEIVHCLVVRNRLFALTARDQEDWYFHTMLIRLYIVRTRKSKELPTVRTAIEAWQRVLPAIENLSDFLENL